MKKKTALITGGSRGIGEAIVRQLAPHYKVFFTYCSSTERAQFIADDLSRFDVQPLQLDLKEKDQIVETISTQTTQDQGFDIVVHNAAQVDDSPFFFMDTHQWEDVIQLSLNSFYYINKTCLSHMIANRWGRIITLASISGESGNRGQVNYSAAKGALIAASKALSKEVGRKGILVNSVSPGIIETDMTKDVPFEHVKPLIPLGRMGTPQEVAHVVEFLASEKASYVNGTVIQVNGGLYT